MLKEIFHNYIQFFQKNRCVLLIPAGMIFLSTIGLMVLASASLSFVQCNYLMRQSTWLALSIFAFVIGAFLPVDLLRKHSKNIYLAGIFLLAIVLIPGIGLAIKGSRRWIALGFFNFQVSEFAKVALLIFLANELAKNEYQKEAIWPSFLRPLLQTAIMAGLLLLEPDYGTTALFLAVTLTLLFLNGVKWRWILASGGLVLLLFAIFIALNPVRLARIMAFSDMEATKLGGSYQLWQGIVGFNVGGITGAGLGHGLQQLHYLPEAHTDFIFPILAEELGFVFAIAVILTYFALFLIAWIQALKISNRFYFLMATGILSFIIYQAFINLGVVMGLLPTKGMALPFLSYGGSNLLLIYFFFGLLFNVFRCAFFDTNVTPKELQI